MLNLTIFTNSFSKEKHTPPSFHLTDIIKVVSSFQKNYNEENPE